MGEPQKAMSALKVALVFPRLHHQTRSFLPPLGLISLATVARQSGHDARLFDSSFDRDLARIKAELQRFAPQVVGFSISTDMYPVAKELCAFAKGIGAMTVMGGPHATICADELWSDCPDLDVIVAGEGEESFPQFLDAIREGREPEGVPGVSYRSGDEVVKNPAGAWIVDIDKLPPPDRDLLPTYQRYRASGHTGLILTRGCPYKCTFCQPALDKVTGRFRKKSAALVAEEIEQLYREDGNRRFHVDDDLFVLHRRWIGEIADELEKRGLLGKVQFVVLSRVDMFDEELALLLRRLGVYYIMFGVESGCQHLLDGLEKKTTTDSIERAFALAHAHGFNTHAFIILGSPDETLDSLRQTEELVRRLEPTSLFISQYAPLPGTDLRQRLEQEGRLNISSMEQMSYFSWAGVELPINIPGLDKAQVVAVRDRILTRRRLKFVLPNLAELTRIVLEKRSLMPALLHGSFFLKKRHFNG